MEMNIKDMILASLETNQQNLDLIESAIAEIQETDFLKGISIKPAQAESICKLFADTICTVLKPVIKSGILPEDLAKVISVPTDMTTETKVVLVNIVTTFIGLMRGIDAHYNETAKDLDSIYYAVDIRNGYIALARLAEAIYISIFGYNAMADKEAEENIDRIADSVKMFIAEGRIWPGTELMNGLKELATLSASAKL